MIVETDKNLTNPSCCSATFLHSTEMVSFKIKHKNVHNIKYSVCNTKNNQNKFPNSDNKHHKKLSGEASWKVHV